MLASDILELIRAERKACKLTQKQVADALGVTRQRYNQMESEGMTLDQLLKVFAYLGLKIIVIPSDSIKAFG